MDDIIHDYEYYEANAQTVNLEDVTSDEHNARILASLRDDDPSVTSFAIIPAPDHDYGDFAVREGDDLGWVGYFVGRSDTVKKLDIFEFQDNINLNAFLRGLEHNRSIESLEIGSLGGNFQSLIPFLRNNGSLRELHFSLFNVGLQCASNIALLLRQQSSLKSLKFDDIVSDDDGLVEIAAALASQPQIEELCLSNNIVGRNGYVALGSALEGCLSLRELTICLFGNDIDDEELIDDEGLDALVEGLKHCRNLTSLNLNGNLMITEEKSRTLSTLFRSDDCQLEYLDLGRTNIDDDGMAALAPGLASLQSLKRVRLQGIRNQGLQHLAEGLVNCNLEVLDISQSMLMDSVSGLRELGTLVRRTTNMHWLSLRNISLTDEGLQSFVEGMANCCNLTNLDLSGNHSITANGLASLSSLLRAEHCNLCKLSLWSIHIGDDGAAALANGLIGNKSLTELGFSATDSGITARGWAAFSRRLCDKSSVNNTYLSNHTLLTIGGSFGTPQDIRECLLLNCKRAPAICKILHGHPDIDITPLFEFNLMCLPLVVEWFEKACSHLEEVNESSEAFRSRQLSAVYKFVRGMPQLTIDGYGRGNNHIAPMAGQANMIAPNDPVKKVYLFFGLIAIIGAFTYCLRGTLLVGGGTGGSIIPTNSDYLTRTILKIKQLEEQREREISQLQDIVEQRERKIAQLGEELTQLEEEREKEVSQLKVIVEQRQREITQLGHEREREISKLHQDIKAFTA